MKVYDDIEKMLCKELEDVTKKGELSAGALEVMYKAIDILKDIETIYAMKDGDYSEDYSGRGGRSYDSYDSYDSGRNSYARGRGRYAKRDSMGRYSRDGYGNDGYSGNDEAVQKLEQMMQNTSNEQEKQVIRRLIDQIRQ